MYRLKFFVFAVILTLSFSLVGQKRYKIMSYNIRYDNNWDKAHSWQDRKLKIIDIIKHAKPGVFGIQEGLLNQVNYIEKNLKNYNYIGVGRDNGKTKGEYTALFFDVKKFKLLQKGTFWLSKTPDKPSKNWDAALNRICTYGLFESLKSKEKLWVFNTHFDHKGSLARLNAARLILSKIENLNTKKHPVILMGDFNDTPEKPPVLLLKNKLTDAFTTIKKPLNRQTTVGTFNGFNNKNTSVRIDYFFTDKVKVVKYQRITRMINKTTFASDHFPILMCFEIEN